MYFDNSSIADPHTRLQQCLERWPRLPQLALSLLLLLLPLFIGFALQFGGLRIRCLLDFLLTTVRVTGLVRGLMLLDQRLVGACPVHDTPPLNILLRVPFPDACLQQVHHISCIVGTII